MESKERETIPAFAYDINLHRQLETLLPNYVSHRESLERTGIWAAGELEETAIYTDRYAQPRLESITKNEELLIINPRYKAALAKANALILRAEMNPNGSQMLPFVYGYLLSQADISIHCPVTMSGAVAYVLKHFAHWKIQTVYLEAMQNAKDGDLPTGATWATERHGGSDIGATTTSAIKGGEHWLLNGLKWFASNAGSDLALATARPEGAPPGSKGLGLYLVPRLKPDGSINTYVIRRLKDKIGTRGLPTGEIQLNGCYAVEIVPPPHGLRVMMEALAYSRVHNAMSAAGVVRRSYVEAHKWANSREAFGKNIIEYPMVQETVRSLGVQAEAALALALEAARAFPKEPNAATEKEKGWSRFATACAKYLTAEMAVAASHELLKLVGGNGYTEEYPCARLYRDAPVLTVWEGPENIQALELIRLTKQHPALAEWIDGRIMAAVDMLPKDIHAERLKRQLLHVGARCKRHFTQLNQNMQNAEIHAKKLLEVAAKSMALTLLAEETAQASASGDANKLHTACCFGSMAMASMSVFSFRNGMDSALLPSSLSGKFP